MSVLKVIVIVVSVGTLAFIGMLVYLFIPDVRTVTDEPAFKELVGKTVTLKRNGWIFRADEGSYRFHAYVLTNVPDWPGQAITTIKANDSITLEEFKTYRSKIGSGFTTLFAIGTLRYEGQLIRFEYDLGTVEKLLYGDDPYFLPLALWQDSTENRIEIIKQE